MYNQVTTSSLLAGLEDFQVYTIVVRHKVTHSFILNCIQRFCGDKIVYS